MGQSTISEADFPFRRAGLFAFQRIMEIGERIWRSVDTSIRQSSDKKRFTFTINTSAKDRHGTVIEPRGVDYSAFQRNPVVLFNHDYDRPIGRAANVQLRGDALIAEVEFDEEDEFAQGIRRKVEQKYLNGASIGFMIREWTEDEEDSTFRVIESELVEFSIVTVPSNRDALVMSRSLSGVAQELRDELAEIKSLREELAALKGQQRTAPQSGAAVEAPSPIADEAIQQGAEPVTGGDGTSPEVPEDEPTHDVGPTTPVVRAIPKPKGIPLSELLRLIDDRTDRMLGRK